MNMKMGITTKFSITFVPANGRRIQVVLAYADSRRPRCHLVRSTPQDFCCKTPRLVQDTRLLIRNVIRDKPKLYLWWPVDICYRSILSVSFVPELTDALDALSFGLIPILLSVNVHLSEYWYSPSRLSVHCVIANVIIAIIKSSLNNLRRLLYEFKELGGSKNASPFFFG